MSKTNFEFTIGSDIDFDNLVADIGFNDNLVAMLTQEHGFQNLRIRIYPPQTEAFWDFKLDEFESIIHTAKHRLWELRKASE